MAETYKPEKKCVYVDTNLDTHLLVLVHHHETISDFKEKLCKEHLQCFPKLGEIDISAVKVKRQHTLGLLLDYHLPDSMFLSKAFDGVSHSCWFVFVDAAVSVMDADKNSLNLEKEDNEIATDCLLLDGNQNPEEDLETEMAEKTTKKRELELSHGEKSQKNISKDDVNQSSAAANVASLPISKGENLNVPFLESTQKDIDMGDDDDQTDTGNHTENHLDTKSESTARPDTEKKKGSESNDDINQPSTAALTTNNRVPENVDYVDDSFESLPLPRGESPFAENEMAEVFVEDVGRDNTETSSGTRPDTEKKKSSKDDTTRASGGIVNEKNGVPGNEDPVGGATLENLGIPCAEASQKVGGGKAEPSVADNNDMKPCNVEIDADEAKSMKPTKKRKSKKSKTPAEENVKKSSKKSNQVLSVEVNNNALEETYPINSTKDIDASLLRKCSGDNFGCIQNQEKPDQVVSGVKDKSGLHLHPSASIYVSSLKPRERKSRVQQSVCSGTYRVQSRVQSVRSESMSDAAIRAQSDDDSPVDCVPDSESL